jgi:hypothetical protein
MQATDSCTAQHATLVLLPACMQACIALPAYVATPSLGVCSAAKALQQPAECLYVASPLCLAASVAAAYMCWHACVLPGPLSICIHMVAAGLAAANLLVRGPAAWAVVQFARSYCFAEWASVCVVRCSCMALCWTAHLCMAACWSGGCYKFMRAAGQHDWCLLSMTEDGRRATCTGQCFASTLSDALAAAAAAAAAIPPPLHPASWTLT